MIKHELPVFVVVGTLTVVLDFMVYRGLAGTGVIEADIAKAMGFLAGTAFAYIANRFWTFRHTHQAHGSAWRFMLLYCLALGINVTLNALALSLFGKMPTAISLAFLTATAVSATLNFVGMKVFVFKAATMSQVK